MATTNRPELVEKLTDGIARLTSSEGWQRYLDFQAQFHNYSFGNVLLIAAQCHGATRVAGFRAWQRMNRFVRKGEKAIWILAPMIYRNAEAEPEDDRVVRGFKYVPVFDLAQTDGEELPEVCTRLSGDDSAGAFLRMISVAQSIGFSVENAELSGGVNGDCTPDLKRIRVEVGNSPAQRVKTLTHELAHALLHETFEDRRLAELEAESTAYIVCQNLGVDSSDYSFGYVATWAGGGESAIAGIRASGERIQRAAETILSAFDSDEEAAA